MSYNPVLIGRHETFCLPVGMSSVSPIHYAKLSFIPPGALEVAFVTALICQGNEANLRSEWLGGSFLIEILE